ncbi:MAG: hypothetical protein L3J33_03325 [Rhodobacteraceae bacterium]|nr:hypothetical protein [Paracoccaceae bacterium]
MSRPDLETAIADLIVIDFVNHANGEHGLCTHCVAMSGLGNIFATLIGSGIAAKSEIAELLEDVDANNEAGELEIKVRSVH